MNISAPQHSAACLRRPRLAYSAPVAAAPTWDRTLEEREFALMTQAFGRHGGLYGGDQVAGLVRGSSGQPIATLARWIVSREVISIVRDTAILLPMFQFHRQRMQVRTEVRDTLQLLRDVFDDWELAVWFARPNAWLDDAPPVDVMPYAADEVVRAAQADRFVALG